jgi:hypothetical protein
LRENNKSIFEKDISPYKQAAFILAALILLDVIVLAINSGSHNFLARTYWTNAITFTFVYAIFNAIFSLSARDQNSYWFKSILSYVVICIVGGVLAYSFSKLNIDEAGSYRWMYTVFTMVYILILGIIRTMRKIVSIAQKKDKRMRGEE